VKLVINLLRHHYCINLLTNLGYFNRCILPLSVEALYLPPTGVIHYHLMDTVYTIVMTSNYDRVEDNGSW
jgi:hypothetical protein